jgi:molybdate transport system substrate-binding protein
MRLPLSCLSVLLCAMLAHAAAQAAEAQVAVAANFAEPIKAIAAVLQKTTGHTLKVSTGASGAFYTQIRNGAPFDVFLSADDERPALLEKDGLAQPGTRFTYATGKLALWSLKAGRVDSKGAVLRATDLGKVAYANPRTAPYGAAAVQVLDRLGLKDTVAPKLVQGESIGQAYGFVKTGNADIGFVALSQVLEGGRLKEGSVWTIPQELHDAIRQDAVILKKGADNAAAQALVKLLQSPNIRDLIRSYGYDI